MLFAKVTSIQVNSTFSWSLYAFIRKCKLSDLTLCLLGKFNCLVVPWIFSKLIASKKSWNILQYFWSALSDNQYWKPSFGVLLEWLLKTGFTVFETYFLIPQRNHMLWVLKKTVGWSAVCDCDISWSYLVAFFTLSSTKGIPKFSRVRVNVVAGSDTFCMCYNNLSWVWGQYRKICPEGRRLASRGLPSDDKRWSSGTDFSILPSHE